MGVMDKALLYKILAKNGAEKSASGNPVVLTNMKDGQPLDITATWQPQQDGEGTPSPDNIRPIHGRDSVKVTRYGANLLRGTKTLERNDEIFDISGVIQTDELFNGCYTLRTKRAWAGYKFDFSKVAERCGLKVGDVVTYSIWVRFSGVPISERSFTWFTRIKTGSTSQKVYSGSPSEDSKKWIQLHYTMTVTEELLTCDCMRIESSYYEENSNYTTTIANAIFACPKLELGSSPSGFSDTDVIEPESLSLLLPFTIYGGNLNLNGEGQQEWALLTLDGTENWKADENYINLIIKDIGKEANKGMCSHLLYSYDYGGRCLFVDLNHIYVGAKLRLEYTLDSWKAYLADQYAKGTPVQIAYKLAEPIPFKVTGGGKIKALAGTNTIMTDADSVTVKSGTDTMRAKKIAMLLGE